MKIRFQILIFLLIAAGSFLAGSWVTYQSGKKAATPERKILHYVDPMNPALKFDKPGIAPCGMPLVPVYADSMGPVGGGMDPQTPLPPGTVRISPEKQQLIGVRVIAVEKVPWTHTLRVLGRVTPDETLVYRINAATDGWIEKTMPVTTGSLVKEQELLATLSFFSLEYRTLVQNYFNLYNLGQASTPDALANNPQYSAEQLRKMRKSARFAGDILDSSQVDYYRKSLYNYGISPYQLKEMERTMTFPEVVEIRAPAAGFILFRNVSPGLRLDRGVELFRIADLSRVWILADIFENEASFFKPGLRVRMELPYQKKTLYAQVSPVLPQFDPTTRTFKVRLVADNPGFALRPDMFVNVELPVSGPAAIVVPVDAVLDSGLKKTVFIDRGNGIFESRMVETGRHLGERVEIVGGLMQGEKIVVSGNFLIDSEAKMQQATSGIAGNVGFDLVCRMNVDEDRARAEGNFREYRGKTYFFCSPECRDDFGKEPKRYLKTPAAPSGMKMPASPGSMKMPASPGSIKMPASSESMNMPASPGSMKMPASTEDAAKHISVDTAAVPKANSAKAAIEAGDGMKMPQGGASVAGPDAGPMFTPSADAPKMGQNMPSLPAQGSVSMPQAPSTKLDATPRSGQ